MAWTECNVVNIEKPTLLWENSSPDSAFAAQTINIDVRNYKAIGFLIQNRNDSDYPTQRYQTYIIRTRSSISNEDALGAANFATNPTYSVVRRYTINSSTGAITFTAGRYTGSGGSADWNYCVIPLKIYGYEDIPTPVTPDLKDVNPNLSAAEPFRLALKYYNSAATCSSTCVKGYSKVKVKAVSSSGYSISFYDNAGTVVGSTTSLTTTNWTEITIPSGAYIMQAKYTGTSSNNTVRSVYYALLV